MLELSKKSLSSRLYRFFYQTEKMPINLCPYFWKLLLAYILIIPIAVVTFPGMILLKIQKKELVHSRLYSATVAAITTTFLSVSVLSLILIFFGYNHTSSKFQDLLGVFQRVGLVIAVVALFIGLIFIFLYTKEKYEKYIDYNRYRNNFVKKPNIIVEFIKATYKKYCPMITWKND